MSQGDQGFEPATYESVPPDKLYVTAKAIVRRGAELLLLREREPSGRVVLDLPGGRLDTGEDLHAGLRRELREELGVEAAAISPLPTHTWTAVTAEGTGVVALAYDVELASGEATDRFDHGASPEVLGAVWITAEEHAAAPDFIHKAAIAGLFAD